MALNKTAEEMREMEKACRQSLIDSGQAARWRDAMNAMAGKGPTVEDQINVKVNRFMPDLLMVLARDVKVLLGTRPYFPLAAENEDYEWEIRQQEKLVDTLADRAGYESEQSLVYYWMRGLGTSYMELGWDIDEQVFTRRKPVIDEVLQIPVDKAEQDVTEIVEGLSYTARGPWETLLHPHGRTLDDTPIVFVKDIMTVEDVQEMHDTGALKIPSDVTTEKLKAGPDGGWGDEWGAQWRRDKAMFQGRLGENIGLMMRCYENPTKRFPDGRWVYLWNYTYVLYEGEPKWAVGNKKWKPLVMFNELGDIGPGGKYGLGLYEQTRHVAELGDRLLSTWIDANVKAAGPAIFYDENTIDGKRIRGVPYERVPFKPGSDPLRWKEAVQPMTYGQTSDQLFTAYKETDAINDRRVNAHYPSTGEPPPRKETFGTTQILEKAGAALFELKAKLIEGGPLKRQAILSCKLVDANASQATVAEIIGEQQAVELLSADPEAIPGGYKCTFEGSDMIAEIAGKTETMMQIWTMFGQDPEVQAKHIIRRRLLRLARAGFTDDEINEMLPSPTEMPQGPPGGMAGGPIEPVPEIIPRNEIPTPSSNAEMGVQG